MTVLVLLDHEAGLIKQPSRSAVAAAVKLGEVHVLVAGVDEAAVAAAAALAGVSKVITAADSAFDHAMAEPLAALLVSLQHHRHQQQEHQHQQQQQGRCLCTW